MAELASLADYGARHGMTKQAAAKWKTRGYLVLQGEMVDVEASDTKMKACAKGPWNVGVKAVRRRLKVDAAPSTVNLARQPATTDLGGRDPYPCRDHLTDPADRAAVALLPHTAYRIGGAAALAAHDLGMAPATAERLRLHVATAAMEIVGMIMDEAGIRPPPGDATWCDVALFDPDKVSVVDWAKA